MWRNLSGFIVLVVAGLVGMNAIGIFPRVEAQHQNQFDSNLPSPPLEATLQERLAAAGQGDLVVLSAMLEGDQQQVTVIDSNDRVMSVYHIDPHSGAITLKSVRNISADLRIDVYNGGAPAPQEIRALLNQQ